MNWSQWMNFVSRENLSSSLLSSLEMYSLAAFFLPLIISIRFVLWQKIDDAMKIIIIITDRDFGDIDPLLLLVSSHKIL
jgi:hypothetical protein